MTSPPDIPIDYKVDNKIPFQPDGNGAAFSDSVEMVIGNKGPFEGLLGVRKNIFKPDNMDEDQLRRLVTQETRALYNARHKHVVQLLHTYFDLQRSPMKFCIVMERAETHLGNHLNPESCTAANLARPSWVDCLLRAIQHIHSLGIRHRDIKPTNILVKNTQQVLLADFGISKMGIGKTMPTTGATRLSAKSVEYCAPEVDQGSTRGRSADIFSLAAVFLEICVAHSGKAQYQSLRSIVESRKQKGYAKNIDRVHEWMTTYELQTDLEPWQQIIIHLCQAMLQADRHQRPIASDLGLTDPQLQCTCPNTVPVTNESGLLQACIDGNFDAVTGLLRTGVNPGLMGAIHLAAEGGFDDIVETLLSRDVDVDSRNQVDQTPLHCASRSGRESVVKMLLDKGANVDARDETKQTPLHGAAAHGYETIVRLLLESGAESEARNSDLRRPITLAKGRRQFGVVQILDDWKNHGTTVSDINTV